MPTDDVRSRCAGRPINADVPCTEISIKRVIPVRPTVRSPSDRPSRTGCRRAARPLAWRSCPPWCPTSERSTPDARPGAVLRSSTADARRAPARCPRSELGGELDSRQVAYRPAITVTPPTMGTADKRATSTATGLEDLPLDVERWDREHRARDEPLDVVSTSHLTSASLWRPPSSPSCRGVDSTRAAAHRWELQISAGNHAIEIIFHGEDTPLGKRYNVDPAPVLSRRSRPTSPGRRSPRTWYRVRDGVCDQRARAQSVPHRAR